MSRSGYTDDCEGAELAMWRGAVASAIRGKRGQALLRETLAALDAMPVKELIAHDLVQEGDFCTLGVVGKARGIDLVKLDPEDRHGIAEAFGIAPALAAEIVFMNDDVLDEFKWADVEICGPMRPQHWESRTRQVRVPLTGIPAKRWRHMRDWVAKQLKEDEKPAVAAL